MINNNYNNLNVIQHPISDTTGPNNTEFSFDELKTILSSLFIRHSLSKQCFKDIIDAFILSSKFNPEVINKLPKKAFYVTRKFSVRKILFGIYEKNEIIGIDRG